MSRRQREVSVFVLVTVCLLFLLLDSTQFFARFDLTEDHTFTISPVTKQLLRGIPQEVHINYYVSDQLRQMSPVPGEIIDTLQEYAAVSHGKIHLSVIDPSNGQAAEAVRRFGIIPQQMKVIRQNEQRVAEVYSGMEIEYLDRSVAIPFVFNPRTLEYSLTLTIRRLVTNSSSIVGVLVGDPSRSLQTDFSTLQSQLSLSFDVRDIRPGSEIPPETSVLVVLGGTELTRQQILPIDQFVMSGGHVLFAAKALRVETKDKLSAVPVAASPLLDMLDGFGVDVGSAMVLDDSAKNYRLPQNILGQVKWMDLGKYPEWVSVLPENVSLENPITRRFPGLDLLWPSPLHFNGRKGVTAEVLAKSTKNAWLMRPPFDLDPFHVVGKHAFSDPSKGQYALAYALVGHFTSYFARSNTSANADSKTPGIYGKLLTESPETRMLVIGDDDFASDLMQFSDSGYNAIFVENAVEWLSADADLLAIKTRNFQDTRLVRIQDVSRRKQLVLVAEVVNVALVPLLILVVGFVRAYSRRERLMLARAQRRARNAADDKAS